MPGVRLLCVCCALALVGLAPSAASASSVTIGGDGIVVSTGTGSESVSLALDAVGQLALTGLSLLPGALPAGCTSDGYRLTCPRPRRVEVDLGPGDDRLSAWDMTLPMTVHDGAGNDVVQAGPGGAVFTNDDGDDRFTGHNGDDRFLAGPGADYFEGNGSFDTVSYAAETRPVRVDARYSADDPTTADDGPAGEDDTIAFNIERIEGGSGDDVIVGAGATQQVAGGPGDDILRAGTAWPYDVFELDGGAGADRLEGGVTPSKLNGGDGATFIIMRMPTPLTGTRRA